MWVASLLGHSCVSTQNLSTDDSGKNPSSNWFGDRASAGSLTEDPKRVMVLEGLILKCIQREALTLDLLDSLLCTNFIFWLGSLTVDKIASAV